MTAFLMIFQRFPTSFWGFPKIFQNCSEYQMNVPEHSWTFLNTRWTFLPRLARYLQAVFIVTNSFVSLNKLETWNIFREFLKNSENFWGFPKTSEEDPKMFRWYTNEFKYNVRDKPDGIERYDTHKGDIRKIRHSGPGWSGVWNLRVV